MLHAGWFAAAAPASDSEQGTSSETNQLSSLSPRDFNLDSFEAFAALSADGGDDDENENENENEDGAAVASEGVFGEGDDDGAEEFGETVLNIDPDAPATITLTCLGPKPAKTAPPRVDKHGRTFYTAWTTVSDFPVEKETPTSGPVTQTDVSKVIVTDDGARVTKTTTVVTTATLAPVILPPVCLPLWHGQKKIRNYDTRWRHWKAHVNAWRVKKTAQIIQKYIWRQRVANHRAEMRKCPAVSDKGAVVMYEGLRNGHDHVFSLQKDFGDIEGDVTFVGPAARLFTKKARCIAPLYRIYNEKNGDHFMTTSVRERNRAMGRYKYKDRGIVGWLYARPAPGLVPLYRLAKVYKKVGYHVYAAGTERRDEYIKKGYKVHRYPMGYLFPPE
ncbi:hypothetical protein HGRIS_013674 [Hohenbuehelia grisea]|uniref:DUF5648 domain-containing protein n=1 Tax=Hohenbuehelia grisea TaxID=104357 RepID=A0ABR3IW38_9AGAR